VPSTSHPRTPQGHADAPTVSGDPIWGIPAPTSHCCPSVPGRAPATAPMAKPQLCYSPSGSPLVAKPPPERLGTAPQPNLEPPNSLGTGESQPTVNHCQGTRPTGQGRFWPLVLPQCHPPPQAQQPEATTRPDEARWRCWVMLEQRVPAGAWCLCHPGDPQAASTRCRETGARVRAAIHPSNTLQSPGGELSGRGHSRPGDSHTTTQAHDHPSTAPHT